MSSPVLTTTARDIIEGAYRATGITPARQAVKPYEVQRGLDVLNLIIKHWQAQDMHLWSKTEGIIPLKKVLSSLRSIDKKYIFSKKAVDGLRRSNPAMNKGRVQDKNDTCATVGAHLAKVSLNSTDPVLKENGKYRRFTPREVARIQSFPDSFNLINSEGKQYKALGNAVPPVVMWHISKSVIKQLQKKMILNIAII